MAPGPARSGIATGKAAMLRISSCSIACVTAPVLRSVRLANTISKAIQNSSRPPAMRKAGKVMPRWRRSQSPMTALPARMAKAMIEARVATCRRSARENPPVSPRNSGTIAIGSMITSKVTKAAVSWSNVIGMTLGKSAVACEARPCCRHASENSS